MSDSLILIFSMLAAFAIGFMAGEFSGYVRGVRWATKQLDKAKKDIGL